MYNVTFHVLHRIAVIIVIKLHNESFCDFRTQLVFKLLSKVNNFFELIGIILNTKVHNKIEIFLMLLTCEEGLIH